MQRDKIFRGSRFPASGVFKGRSGLKANVLLLMLTTLINMIYRLALEKLAELFYTKCWGGEIGRRTTPRELGGNPWEFESPPQHFCEYRRINRDNVTINGSNPHLAHIQLVLFGNSVNMFSNVEYCK